jgi:hypothetical protein
LREGIIKISSIHIPTILFLAVAILLLPGCEDKKGLLSLAPEVEGCGDINDNGLANEIADAVTFLNYFIRGTDAFGSHAEASMERSDLNHNGIVLQLGDFVYLVRIIVGDANAYPKPPVNTLVEITFTSSAVRFNSPVDLGAVLLIFRNNSIGTISLGNDADNMDWKSGVRGENLHVLVYKIGSEAINSGEGELLKISNGSALIGAEAASYDGWDLNVEHWPVPSEHALAQNYPNPFSVSTMIVLNLVTASDWSITILDLYGEEIREYSGHSEAGVVTIEWDGADADGQPVDDGAYFYRAEAGDFIATRSMILLR